MLHAWHGPPPCSRQGAYDTLVLCLKAICAMACSLHTCYPARQRLPCPGQYIFHRLHTVVSLIDLHTTLAVATLVSAVAPMKAIHCNNDSSPTPHHNRPRAALPKNHFTHTGTHIQPHIHPLPSYSTLQHLHHPHPLPHTPHTHTRTYVLRRESVRGCVPVQAFQVTGQVPQGLHQCSGTHEHTRAVHQPTRTATGGCFGDPGWGWSAVVMAVVLVVAGLSAGVDGLAALRQVAWRVCSDDRVVPG